MCESGLDMPALDEIEITPAMIEAGVMALCDFEPDTGRSLAEMAVSCFNAMAAELPVTNRNENVPCGGDLLPNV